VAEQRFIRRRLREVRGTDEVSASLYPRVLGPEEQCALEEPLAERLAAEKLLVKKYLEIIGGMQRASVKLMTGSDFGANPLLFPGWGVHDEMALLVKAGLTSTKRSSGYEEPGDVFRVG